MGSDRHFVLDCGTLRHFVSGCRISHHFVWACGTLCHFVWARGTLPFCTSPCSHSAILCQAMHLAASICVCGQRLIKAQAVGVQQWHPTYADLTLLSHTSHLVVWSHSIIPPVSYEDKEKVLTILCLICKTIKIACAIWSCFPFEKLCGELRRKPEFAGFYRQDDQILIFPYPKLQHKANVLK